MKLDGRDNYAEQRQSILLFDLLARENYRARMIAHYVDLDDFEGAREVASDWKSLFDEINGLLKIATMKVTLDYSVLEQILARHQDSNRPYSIAQMSDGERNAVVIAANVLTAGPGEVLLIEEPERHLHRSIVEPFLSALVQRRKDCAFVVSTHEIGLPVAHRKARTLMVCSCTWRGDEAVAWDVELLDANENLPEDLIEAILGSRKTVLFVEGNDSSSLDLPLYNALFPGVSVVPRGGCAEVLRAVKGIRGSVHLHQVQAFGLIDRDERPDDEVRRLAKESVHALDVHSAEALYYCSDAIAAVAHHQAETLMRDADVLKETAIEKALDTLKEGDIAERMAARRSERHVRDLLLAELPDSESIRKKPREPICASIPSPFPDELRHFRELLADNKLDELVARYPLRKSRVFDVIARALHFTGKDNYERALLSRLQSNFKLAQSLKQRIQSLSDALEIKA